MRYVAVKGLDQTKDRSPAKLGPRPRAYPKLPKDPADEQTTAYEQGARAPHDRDGIAAGRGKNFRDPGAVCSASVSGIYTPKTS